MKRIQKIISTLLIVMLIAVQLIPIINVKAEEAGTLTITTYGENEDGIRSDLVTNTAKLTVSHLTNGDEFTAYKIIDIFYNQETNEMTYDFTTNFRNFLYQNEDYGQTFTVERYFELTSDEVNESCPSCTSVITTSTLNALVSKYATYIRNNSIKSDKELITNFQGEMWVAAVDVVAGAYLILPKSIVTTEKNRDFGILEFVREIYGVMVGNVMFTPNENNLSWELRDREIYAKSIGVSTYSAMFNFSMSDYMGVMNGTIDQSQLDMSIYTNVSSSIGRGKLFYSYVEIPEQPTNSINNTLQLEIELPSGMIFDNENPLLNIDSTELKIVEDKLVDSDNKEYGTITFEGQKIIINMLYKEGYGTADFGIILEVELDNNAVVGEEGNIITTTLSTIDDPYVENSIAKFTTTNTIYTYGLELTNLSKDDSTLLKGAKYEVYSKYTDSVLSNKIGEFTVGDDGKASFAGVPSGTIYLKQVKAPTGYQLIKEPIAVEIATEDATAGTQEGYYQVITYNDAMWYLPSTGGIGTIIYTLIGLGVIGISSIIIIKYKKRMA